MFSGGEHLGVDPVKDAVDQLKDAAERGVAIGRGDIERAYDAEKLAEVRRKLEERDAMGWFARKYRELKDSLGYD